MLRKYVTRTTVIIAIGVLAFVGILCAILLSSHPSNDSAQGSVQIELRTSRPAQLRVGGRPLGTAPRLIDVPTSTTPIQLQADYGRGRVITRSVVPDKNQVVDLN